MRDEPVATSESVQAFTRDTAALALPSGPCLRLGLVDALLTAHRGGSALAAALGECCATLAGLDVQLTTLRPIEIERGILAAELDVGVLAAHAPAAGLEQHRLYGEDSSLFVAPGHPWYERAQDDPGTEALRQAAIVVDPYWDEVPQLELAGMLRGRTRANSIEGVALLVASGRFVGFLPDHLVASTAQLHALRRVHPDRYSDVQDIMLTCKRGNAEPAVRELLRRVQRCVP
jgi:LysR family transcriptional regulator, transcriptional activator for bauABCD operon